MGLLAALAVPAGLYVLDKMFGGSVSGGSSINKAAGVSQEGMNKAVDMIRQGTKEAQAYNAPYINPQDFLHLAQLVRSGYFQTPFGKSFTPQQFNTPGFNFNPGAGSMGYSNYNAPIQGSIVPQGLPTPPPYMAPPQGPVAPPPSGQGMPTAPPMFRPDRMQTGIENMMVSPPVLAPLGPQPQVGPDPRLTGPRSPTAPTMTMADLFRLGLANRFGSGTFMPKWGA